MPRLDLLAAAAVASLAPVSPADAPKGKSDAVRDYAQMAIYAMRCTENEADAWAKFFDADGLPFYGNVRTLTCTHGKKDAKVRPTATNVPKVATRLAQGEGGGVTWDDPARYAARSVREAVLGIDDGNAEFGPPPYRDCRIAERCHLPWKKLSGPASEPLGEASIRGNCVERAPSALKGAGNAPGGAPPPG